jgi:putative transposase
MLKAYKYRLYPNQEQASKIEKHFGCCRLVWNLALTAKQYAFSTNKITLSRYDLQKQLVELKEEYDWLYEINSQSLQSVLLNLDNAYKSFFKGGGFPKYRGRKGDQSFQCPQNVGVDYGCGIVKLPKIGMVKSVLSRQFTGQIKTCSISRTAIGKYYISNLVDDKKQLPLKPAIKEHKTIGIDVGIKSFVVSSDGRTFEPNRQLKDNLKRLKVLQRPASRKKKGSKYKKKAYLKVAILHEKITCKRSDYIHKVTNALVRG